MKRKFSAGFILVPLLSISTTLAQNPETDTMRDARDGQQYDIIKIGSYWWMAENLNFDAGNCSWCYDDNPINCKMYGRLYDWETAMVACPAGWHLSSDKEWKDFEKALGVSNHFLDQMGWRDCETDLLYEEGEGMKIIMGGYRPYGDGAYDDGNDDAYFWTSTEKDRSDAWKRYLDDQRMQIGRGYDDKREGFSVRCVKK
jgi:uncharacterized protein (TIGR02145 family)